MEQEMGNVVIATTASAFKEAARGIIAHAEHEQRDLSEFEAGRVDALLEVAEVFRRVERAQLGA